MRSRGTAWPGAQARAQSHRSRIERRRRKVCSAMGIVRGHDARSPGRASTVEAVSEPDNDAHHAHAMGTDRNFGAALMGDPVDVPHGGEMGVAKAAGSARCARSPKKARVPASKAAFRCSRNRRLKSGESGLTGKEEVARPATHRARASAKASTAAEFSSFRERRRQRRGLSR